MLHHKGQVALLWQRDHATCLSVEILQLHNIPFENLSPGPIVRHYFVILHLAVFIHLSVTHTQRQTDRQTHDDSMYPAYHSVARKKMDHIELLSKYNYQATSVG